MTITLQIGNTDDKLSQLQWSRYITSASNWIQKYCESGAARIHFFGTSPGDEPWQNACWVFDISIEDEPNLRQSVLKVAGIFNQDSVAWTSGTTEIEKAIQ